MKTTNRKAKYNYKLLKQYEAGISLLGAEVKAIKKGHIDLSRSHAKIINNEAYLVNANISIEDKTHNPTRTRKLLLKKKQISSLKTEIKAKKLTLIPTKVYTKGRLIKVEIALAKPKRKFEKKELIKRRDIEREIERELRGEKDR